LRTTPPDRILNEPVKPCLPSGNASKPLCDLIARADALLREHDVNLVRQDLGENPATGIWPWGHGPLPTLPAFQERHGVHGTLVAGGDVVRGIGRLIGWNVLDLTGATGLADTDYAAKGRAAMAAMDSYDLVCVHVQAPHTLGMLGDAAGKARALEAIDRQVVAPLLERLQAEPDWRLLVIAAQASGAVRHPELAGRTPFILGGTGVESHRGEAFDEQNAAHGELHLDRASDLMEYFLRR
jgi:2,3-bisphosphoglycerate-independent phosphoglycerate mutase